MELKFSLNYLFLAHSAQTVLWENLVNLCQVENSALVFLTPGRGLQSSKCSSTGGAASGKASAALSLFILN